MNTSSALHQAATELVPSLLERGREIEEGARVPTDVARQLADAEMFRMLVPKAFGGREVTPEEFVDVLAVLGEGSAAAAWCVMTGATTTLLSAYLDENEAQKMFSEPGRIFAGIFAPMGKAIPVEGGFRLSGRWPFASGCDNAEMCMGGALVLEDGRPRMLPSGGPEIRSMFFSMEAAKIHRTWDTLGLRGTGSHDVEVEDLFVPQARTCSVFVDRPRDEPLYRFPIFGLLAAGVAAVGIGIGRRALVDGMEVAKSKRIPGSQRTLADSSPFQLELAQAKAELMAGEAALREQCRVSWAAAEHRPLDEQERAALRLAAGQAAQASIRAVDAMYAAGGGRSLYRKCPLERHFRDVHTLSQHVMVSTGPMRAAGKVLLGLDVDSSQL